MPTDASGNPCCESPANPDLFVDVENWCEQYRQLKTEHTPLIQLNIGIYQIGQALRSRTKYDMREAVGASILHCLTALAATGGGIAQSMPMHFSDGIYTYKAVDMLDAVCGAIQLFFYRQFARAGSYRKDRVSVAGLQKKIWQIVNNICGLIPPNDIGAGIVAAAEILNKEAYKE